MNVAQILNQEILPTIQKASRYLGNEWNAVHKSADTVEVRLALAFPDLYDVGLGNLGLHILYACLNKLDWAGCERVYAPAPDMEAALRERGLPMFALESKDSLSCFDGIGFTLQSELTYTNILNILDLAGLPLRTENRREEDPLTFAGGPAVFNPEPIAPFMDFFVIGDGEDVVVEIAQVLRQLKGAPRSKRLQALSLLEGVYVPALYPFEQLEDGSWVPDESAPKIRKRLTSDLNGATFPTNYIVPFTKQVHDRVSLEVLRGCTQGCRFCQAGMTTRPVRERSLEQIDTLMEKTLENTGYEEVSLVSLSTCDYSRVRQLVENTAKRARMDRVAVSLPSLRLDSFSVELSDMVAEERKTGLTFAPEAASPRLRAVINKWIPDEELLEMSSQAYVRGWDHVKLYFMIGLPTERDDDLEAIADLCQRTLRKGKSIHKRARVNLGVSTFVPKPFTPFQWCEQIGLEETTRKQEILYQRLRTMKGVKFGRHDPEETFLEGLVSRSDRRAADLLEAAFRKGCRLDAWGEHLRFDLWQEAIEEVQFDVHHALRERSIDERLPWDHIDIFMPKKWFQEDWERAKVLEHAQDCRHKKCHRCGVIDEERELCASMLRDNIEARKTEAAWTKTPTPERVEPPQIQRLRLRISRLGASRYLSHLESMNAWIRGLRRAKTPLSYSQGFHPHPRVSFSSANPVGQESMGDYMDIVLVERVSPSELMNTLNETLPNGFGVIAIQEIPLRSPALMSVQQGTQYSVFLDGLNLGEVKERLAEVLSRKAIEVERMGKVRAPKKRGKRGRYRVKVPKIVDIRPMIREAEIVANERPSLEIELISVDGKPGKIREILPLLVDIPSSLHVLKRDTLVAESQGQWVSVSSGWSDDSEGISS